MSSYKNPLVSEKKNREATYNMRRSELESMCKQATTNGLTTGVYVCNAMYSAAMLTVLRDTLGYGQRRLARIFNRVQKLFSEIMEKRISYSDLAQTLMDECGVNLTIEKPDGTSQAVLDLFDDLETPAKITLKINQKK